MKTSITRSSSKLLFLLTLLPGLAPAAELVGKVQAVKGEAFLVEAGVTRTVRADMDIHQGAKILVGDGAKITVGDFFDNRHHLAAGTHVSMEANGFVLQKGAVWTQAFSGKTTFTTTTPNMITLGRKGEWVLTYDVARRRSQLTTITGEVDVASPQEPAFKYAVSAGMFTMSDPKIEEGYPRSPTKLGYESLMQTLALFPGVKSQDAGIAQVQDKTPARAVASAKGELVFITTIEKGGRLPASAEGSAHHYFSQKTAKKVGKKLGSTAPVRVIGYQAVATPAYRLPASKASTQSKDHAPRSTDSEFMKSYEIHQRNQPKHSQEVQRLVDDLKSF
jgi:hypothetical protein